MVRRPRISPESEPGWRRRPGPTSALDAATERLLLDALHRLIEGRTTLIIAHRLSTVRNADRIVVVHEGRIVEEGTHEELLALNGRYAHLHDVQMGPAVEVKNV